MGRGIDRLHPELVPLCREFVRRCRGAGLNVRVTETFRTQAEQDAIYAQGRTKPGGIISNAPYPKSPHCWGVAFDFCRNVKGREYDDSDGFFSRCGAIGKALGLTWGGDWRTFKDKPHLELAKYMPDSSSRWLIAAYGTPERFMQTWEDETMTQEQFNKMFAEAMRAYNAEQRQKPASEWARESIAEAVKLGITDGTAPRAGATREEVATMLVRMIDLLSDLEITRIVTEALKESGIRYENTPGDFNFSALPEPDSGK